MKISNKTLSLIVFINCLAIQSWAATVTAILCADQNAQSFTPYAGETLHFAQTTPYQNHAYAFGKGALILRKDGRLALYSDPASDTNFVDLGQATLTTYGRFAVPPNRKCGTYAVDLLPAIQISEKASYGVPFHCTESGGVSAKGATCRSETVLVSFSVQGQNINANCKAQQMLQQGSWYPSEYGGITIEDSCDYQGGPSQTPQDVIAITARRTEPAPNLPSLSAAEQLMAAARVNDISLAQQALQAGADVNSTNIEHSPAIVIAASYQSDDVLKLLLSNKANIESVDADGETATLRAALQGNDSTIKILANQKADLNARNKFYWAPVQLALKEKNSAALKALLSGYADPNIAFINYQTSMNNSTPVIEAVIDGDTNDLSLLLAFHPNLETIGSWGATDMNFTALMWAAQQGLSDVANTLLVAGANPSTRTTDANSKSALDYAMDMYQTPTNKDGRRQIMRSLIVAGLNMNVATNAAYPVYPLIVFAVLGDTEMVQLALQHHADPNVVGYNGGTTYTGMLFHTPLHWALQSNQSAVADLLKAAGGVDK